MKKYRKKPVIVQAMLFDGTMDSGLEIKKWSDQKVNVILGEGRVFLEIGTLEGLMEASPGDYVIKGVKGEFYPCKPDIFAATYEEFKENL